MSAYIYTRGRKKYYFEHPFRSDINIEDIAHALAGITRYTGRGWHEGGDGTYSVAQHCVLGAMDLCERGRYDIALHFLLHDASEAYVGDVSSPLKSLLLRYAGLERLASKAIYLKLRMSLPTPAQAHLVRIWDHRMLLTECRDLFGKSLSGCALDLRIDCLWTPSRAKQEWISAFYGLAPAHVLIDL